MILKHRKALFALCLSGAFALSACGPDETSNNAAENNKTENNMMAGNMEPGNMEPGNMDPNADPNTDPGNQDPNTDPGNQDPNTDPGNQDPNTDPGNQDPNTDPGNQDPNTDPGNQDPNADPGNQTPNADPGNQTPNTDPGSQCGNGVVEGDEVCDGDCPTSPLTCDDGDECTEDKITGSAALCSAVCVNDPIPGCGVTAPGKVGEACMADTMCDANGGVCLTEDQSGVPGGYCTLICNSDAECTGDSRCLLVDQQNNVSICLDGCAADTDCRMGYTCDENVNVCLPAPTGETGKVCMTDMDCDSASGEFCITEDQGFSGGYCSRECQSSSACPDGSQCHINPNDGDGVCLADCSADTDCRAGYGCFDPLGNGYDACYPIADGTGVTGDACTGLSDCSGGQNGFCISEDQGFTGGYCSISGCMADTDCPAGNHCSFNDGQGGVCMLDCVDDTSCTRDGYICGDIDDNQVNECAPGSNGPGAPGDVCTGNADCAGGIGATCIAETDSPDFVGGYCYDSGCTPGGTDCAAGSHCATLQGGQNQPFNLCLPDCDPMAAAGAAGSCRDGYVCTDRDGDQTNECWPGATGMGDAGDACTAVQDCAGGADGACLSEAQGFAGGYCSDFSCTADADCGTDNHCMSFQSQQGTTNLCAPNCTTDADCRAGYLCFDADGDQANECWPGASGAGLPGDACSSVSDCSGGQDGQCIGEDQGFSGGYCTINCTTDQTVCTGDSLCLDVSGDGSFSLCLDGCTPGGSDCRAGYECIDISGQGTQGVCFTPQQP